MSVEARRLRWGGGLVDTGEADGRPRPRADRRRRFRPREDCDVTTLPETLAPEVRAFVEREGLRDTLRLAVRLVQDHFPEVCRIDADLVEDPDTEEQWLSLNAETPLHVEELLARDAGFLADWTEQAAWPERDKIAIMVYPA
jgi:hypothetical protein